VLEEGSELAKMRLELRSFDYDKKESNIQSFISESTKNEHKILAIALSMGSIISKAKKEKITFSKALARLGQRKPCMKTR
jgi:hypothetical protein